MSHQNEERIRQRAYEIWQTEGAPEGCADRHWQQAQQELAGSEAGGSMQQTEQETGQREPQSQAQMDQIDGQSYPRSTEDPQHAKLVAGHSAQENRPTSQGRQRG